MADSLFSAGKWKASSIAYQDALKTGGGDGRLWYRLGASYQAQKKYDEAINACQNSLEVKSTIIPPVFVRSSLAKTYSLNKDSARAFALLADMLANGYANFQDLSSAKEYAWLKTTPQFKAIMAKATLNAYPCNGNPANREFDFWIGKWKVYQTGTDYQVGTSLIQNAVAGCLILENWTAAGNPDEGKSMNFFNSKKGRWEQHYISIAGVSQYYYNGEYKDGAMRYDGDGQDKSGNKMRFHLTYFNQSHDQVRQLLEQSLDRGKTWVTMYDFTYKK